MDMTKRFSLLSKIVFDGNKSFTWSVVIFALRVLTTIKHVCGTPTFPDY